MTKLQEFKARLVASDPKLSWKMFRKLDGTPAFTELVNEYMALAQFLRNDYQFQDDPDKWPLLKLALNDWVWKPESPNDFFIETLEKYNLEITEEMVDETDWDKISPALQLLPSLGCITMTDLHLENVDRILKNFPQAEELELSGNLLAAVPEPIRSIEGLLALNLGSNHLSEFSGFGSCWPKLKILDLQRNKITTFSADILALSNLEQLNISGNGFGALPENGHEKIRHLNIAHNSIQDIQVLKKYPRLEFLGLAGNPLTSFPPLLGLRSLEISSDQFDKMIPVAKEMKQLKTLRIAGNEGKIDVSGIEKLPSLRELSIDNVALENLQMLGELHSLEKLSLSRTAIIRLPEEIFDLRHLIELRVPGNEIIELLDRFNELKFLKLVSIENNQLKNIPDSLLKADLNFVYASGNQFSILERGRIERKRGGTLIYF